MPSIQIQGPSHASGTPLWTAKADIVKEDHLHSFRNLFIDSVARIYTDVIKKDRRMLLPGTFAARCTINLIDLTINGAKYRWYPKGLTISLLLAAAPDDWFPYSDDHTVFITPVMTLVAGEIPISSPSSPAGWDSNFPVIANAANLSLHASGLSFDGQASFDWDDNPVAQAARYHVQLPFGGDPADFRISLDRGTAPESARSSLRDSFARLQALLQPPKGPAPLWAAIELSSKTDVPQFYWEYSAQNQWEFGFEPGEVSVKLTDRGVGDPDRNSASMLPTVSIRKDGSNLTLRVNQFKDTNPDGTPYDDGSQWKYRWDGAGESVSIANIDTVFDPIGVSAFLRDIQGLDRPDPALPDDPANPMLMWAFEPLEDGFAQLPFFNLTEEILIGVFPQQTVGPQAAGQSLIAGALSYSNDLSDQPQGVPPGQHPWSANLLNADWVTGEWRLVRANAGASLMLTSAKLHLSNPQLILNGILWLATAPPTAADLLPSPDNWLNGFRQISLSTKRPGDVLQPPFCCHIDLLTFQKADSRAVSLITSQFSWKLNPALLIDSKKRSVSVLEGLAGSGMPLFAGAKKWTFSPLIWRTHTVLPVVQTLPLTQATIPANAPSHSRQFAPFDLPALSAATDKWSFQADDAAWHWPVYKGSLTASRDWAPASTKSPDPTVIPLASLSLPGLVFDPSTPSAAIATARGFLPAQFRFGLPFLDEVYALSDVAKDHPGDEAKPSGDVAPSREEYRNYWAALGEKNYLARADADDVFTVNGQQASIDNLIEPFSWQIQGQLKDDAYPGTLHFPDATLPLDISGDDALRGIHGNFRADKDGHLLPAAPEAAQFQIVAGSMAAQSSNNQLRDQRGLVRSATTRLTDPTTKQTTLFTPLESPSHPGLALSTSVSPIDLPQGWTLWFRDLPTTLSSGTRIFDRKITRSAVARGVNDPAAQSAGRGELTAYEWRLRSTSEKPEGNNPPLLLFGLTFVPLTLEHAEFDASGALTTLILCGRLLLPWADATAATTRANAVRLTWTGSPLKLTSLAPADRDPDDVSTQALPTEHAGEWVLGDSEDSPRLLWDDISLGTGSVILNRNKSGKLDFFFWGRRWILDVGRIDLAPGSSQTFRVPCPDQPAQAARMPFVNLTIGITNPTSVSLSANLVYQWGQSSQLQIQATESVLIFTFPKSVPPALPALTVSLANDNSNPIFNLKAAVPPNSTASTAEAFQITFSGVDAVDPTVFQLFPGMHLSREKAVSGFATVAFNVNGYFPGQTAPVLSATVAFAELLISADWGDFLQEPGQSKNRIYGSSAGSLRCGFTASSMISDPQKPDWESQLLINGFIEVKNLISWPLQNSDATTFVIPAAQGSGSLNHLRHTVRVLLNQHRPPVDLLIAGPSHCLFGFTAAWGWQFLAIVEHQCIDIVSDVAVNDRRWTTLQEVRIVTPSLFVNFLANYVPDPQKPDFCVVEPRTFPSDLANAVALQDADCSYLNRKLRGALLADDPAAHLGDALIVEASAILWVKGQVEGDGQYTTLQYLPGINQQATLSVLADFDASPGEQSGDWRLIEMPFLGRLQDRLRDGLDQASPSPASALQVDPIVALRTNPAQTIPLLLASWEQVNPRNIPIAHFDQTGQRRWNRLDPASLVESWFRLQTPAKETTAESNVNGLESVLSVRGTDSPGRLSRPATLRQTYESWRAALPPAQPGNNDPQPFDPPPPATFLWRRNAFLTIHADIPKQAGDHRLYIAGAMLTASGLSGSANTVNRYAAATLMPSVLMVDSHPNPEPVTFSVSPYIGLFRQSLTPAAAATTVFGDLICLDPTGTQLRVVASQIWQGAQATDSDGQKRWGSEVRERFATGSNVAVLRLRKIQPSKELPGVATTDYTFDVLKYPDQKAVAQLAHPLRAALARIRYEEGQLCGQPVPPVSTDEHQQAKDWLAPFEAAPPQVRGVQPIYEKQRPSAADTTVPAFWPWGLSAIRFHIQATEHNGQPYGMAGDNTRIWWQGTSHFVQYLSGNEQSDPLLPSLFRAPAILSMLSANPRAILPNVDAAGYSPILPGAWDVILLGARPGVPFVFRHHLISQSSTFSVASGSFPVQHRMPRPAAIPPVTDVNTAVATWASYFDPHKAVGVGVQPSDSAFTVDDNGSPAGLNITLLSFWAPSNKPDPYFEPATIPLGWAGVLYFKMTDAKTGGDPAGWTVLCSMECGRTTLDAAPAPLSSKCVFDFASNDDAKKRLSDFISARQHGDEVTVVIRVERANSAVSGYRQRLVFPLRISRGANLPSAFSPVFARFEDPEYNRRLVSDVARSTGFVANAAGVQLPAVLAVDRRQYNASSRGYVVYSIAAPADVDQNLTIKIFIVGKDGNARPLKSLLNPSKPLNNGIAEFAINGEGQPGEALLVQLVIPGGPADRILVALTVNIVADPVTPVVQSAFALLRRDPAGKSVTCVRFAWSPSADRIELLNPNDLLVRETVRRRAVFQWMDVIRKSKPYSYCVQKIMAGGSTHVPELEEFQAPKDLVS